MLPLCAEPDQGLRRGSCYGVADARRPDRPAVELEVTVARRVGVRAQGRVNRGGSPGPQPLAAGGERLWTRATASVDPALRAHSNAPGYRDLELDGRTIWAACICDSVAGAPAKALVRLSTEGQHDTSWLSLIHI